MKWMIALCAFGLMTMAFSETVSAEGRCPPGYYPTGGADVGWYACAPMGGPDAEEPPAEVDAKWEERWGAIATTTGAFGVASGLPSKKDALSAALSQCQAQSGGRNCAERIVYSDQCVALAWGDTLNHVARGPDLAQVEKTALQGCQNATGNCKIYYSACSYPEQVQ